MADRRLASTKTSGPAAGALAASSTRRLVRHPVVVPSRAAARRRTRAGAAAGLAGWHGKFGLSAGRPYSGRSSAAGLPAPSSSVRAGPTCAPCAAPEPQLQQERTKPATTRARNYGRSRLRLARSLRNGQSARTSRAHHDSARRVGGFERSVSSSVNRRGDMEHLFRIGSVADVREQLSADAGAAPAGLVVTGPAGWCASPP
jgi:hypothetical protein